ncbi:MAG TPA: hypothetical protein VE987_06005 [Polyangiaceae bacterium]|nr:hypothetical protein [Polyangiaceae bacterium]
MRLLAGTVALTVALTLTVAGCSQGAALGGSCDCTASTGICTEYYDQSSAALADERQQCTSPLLYPCRFSSLPCALDTWGGCTFVGGATGGAITTYRPAAGHTLDGEKAACESAGGTFEPRARPDAGP